MEATTIRPVIRPKDRRDFVQFPWRVYADDPNWVPPLISRQLDRLDPRKNPFFRHAHMRLFIAERSGVPAGTVSATINERRNKHLGVRDGYFGFFECIDDTEVARTLIDTAAQWCRDHGMTKLRGPINLDESEEVGVLVDGFDTRPALLLAHTPPHYPRLLEAVGLTKWYETSAWMITRNDLAGDLSALPRRLFVAAERARKRSGVSLRTVDMREWDREVGLLFEMWNQTIALVNQSFVPMEEEELRHLAANLKQLVDPDLTAIAEAPDPSRSSGTRPVGFAVALPDVNQILPQLGGRLLPLGWLKLLRGMRRIDALTFKLMGVVEEYRHRGIEGMLALQVVQAAWDKGYVTCDMSVIDEGNVATQRMLKALGAHPYRTYRLYERDL